MGWQAAIDLALSCGTNTNVCRLVGDARRKARDNTCVSPIPLPFGFADHRYDAISDVTRFAYLQPRTIDYLASTTEYLRLQRGDDYGH